MKRRNVLNSTLAVGAVYGLMLPVLVGDGGDSPQPERNSDETIEHPTMEVRFENGSQLFKDALKVTLVPDREMPAGAEIIYTTDGRDPKASLTTANRYSAPVEIKATTQVRACVVHENEILSLTVSETFIKISPGLVDWSSDLPVMVVDIFGYGRPPDDDFIPASWLILEPDNNLKDGGGRTHLLQKPTLATRAGIRVRGSSSSRDPKMSLAVEAWPDDADSVDKKVAPLGLPKESDWVLSGRFLCDRALIRDPFVFELFRQMGNPSVRTRFVDVYLNLDGDDLEAEDYYGLYVLMEKVKRSSDRVRVHNPTKSGSDSGGYILKIDRPSKRGNETTFSAGGEDGLLWVDPKEKNLTESQSDWVKRYLNDMEAAMTQVMDEPGSPRSYLEYIDTKSWIDHHMLRLFVKDPDGLQTSTFLYKPMNGKLHYGPLWDLDRTMGCDLDDRSRNPIGWNPAGFGINYFTYTWFNHLVGADVREKKSGRSPDFWQDWTDRYQSLRRNQWSIENMHSIIDSMAAEISESAQRHAERWPEISPDLGDARQFNNGKSGWEGEIEHLKGWVNARALWMDDQFVKPPRLNPAGGLVGHGAQITIDSAPGSQKTFYSQGLDDPRKKGGSLAEKAIEMASTMPIRETTSMTIRSRDGELWSGPVYTAFVVDGIPASPEHLLITEMMYHPSDGNTEEASEGHHWSNEFEFVEFMNAGDKTMYLGDLEISGGIRFWFSESPRQTLRPGERIVIVSDQEAFECRYGEGLPVAGQFVGHLNNSGDQVILHRKAASDPATPTTQWSVEYGNSAPWPKAADGEGYSLILRAPRAGIDNQDPNEWTSSRNLNGSPGLPEPEVKSP